MYKGMKVAVIIPFLNEAANISRVVDGIPESVDFIVAVDDGSTDEGPSILASLSCSRLTRIRNPSRLGVGGAIMKGHMAAKEMGSEIDAVMAGDGQMDPIYLSRLLDQIVIGFDYAKGNRFMHPGHERGMPAKRVVGNRLLGLLMKFVSGYWRISDPQNGYTALKTSMLDRIESRHLWHGYYFENDMLIHLNAVNARVCDVPIPARYGSEKSGIDLSSFIPLTFMLMAHRLFWRLWRKSR